MANLDCIPTSTRPVEFPQKPHGEDKTPVSLEILLTNSHLFHPFHPPGTPRAQRTPSHVPAHSQRQPADIPIL